MASNPSSSESRQVRWTSVEVYTLLATLNSRIEDISCEFQTDKKDGVAFAADLLSEAVGNGCSPERVTSKIKSLWNNARPDGAGKQPDSLYKHGAWTRTLPELNRLYPGMLENLSNAGLVEQRGKSKLDHISTHAYGLRRTMKEEYNDPYDCRCGYFHYASSSVHCSNCYTWQHVWCYYKTDDKERAPETHTCDKCATQQDSALESDAILQQAMANLEIRGCPVRKQENLPNLNSKRSAIFDLPPDGDFYGLDSKELHLKVRSITSVIDVIAHSLNSEHFELCKLSSRSLNQQSDICNILKVLGVNAGDKTVFSSTEQTNLLRSVLAASIWQWTCYSTESTNVFGSPSNTLEAVSYARTQMSLDPRELKALRTIHHRAWITLAIDKPDILQPIITREAEELTRRLFCMLSVLLKRKETTEIQGFLRTVEDWIHHTPLGVSRFKCVKQLFDRSIKLRNLFAMSEYLYELQYPTCADTRFMNLDTEDLGKKVQFCFAPAILEYEPDPSQRAEWGVNAVIGSQRFISATPERRQDSRLAHPAVVKFRQ